LTALRLDVSHLNAMYHFGNQTFVRNFLAWLNHTSDLHLYLFSHLTVSYQTDIVHELCYPVMITSAGWGSRLQVQD